MSAKVKPLVWEQNCPNTPNSVWVLVREIDRSYTIDPESNVFRLSTSLFPSGDYGLDDRGLYPTLDAAKAAAHADYERRIRAALSPAAPEGEKAALSENEREDKLATVTAPDNAPASEVLDYVLMCARLWAPEARIIGNARAGDIVRAFTHPAPQAVTEAMVEAALKEVRKHPRTKDQTEKLRTSVRRQIKAALEADR